jgi:uncharacterized protein YbaR (Trm112 family)
MISEELKALLCCPKCKNDDLDFDKNRAICRECKTKFDFE